MSKTTKIVRIIAFLLLFAAAISLSLSCSAVSSADITDTSGVKTIRNENEEDNLFLSENGKLYADIDKIVICEGYYLSGKTDDTVVYKKDRTDIMPEMVIRLDLKNEKAYKNEFVFDIKDCAEIKNGIIYLESESIKSILNINIAQDGNDLQISPLTFPVHGWTQIANGIVAHAGGCVDAKTGGINCREAVINSYNHGDRVFEMDFNLTSDGKLAVVHDWDGYDGMKSSEEWKKIKIWDIFTSMMLGDVLDIMLVNKDMFLITDTKSFDYTPEQIAEQFKILVDTAKEKDPSLGLLNRIIPQLYNPPMYNTVMKQYKFKSLIFTLYETPPEDEGTAINFVKKRPEIKVVTMAPPRNTPEMVKTVNDSGRYVYLHTINDLQEIADDKKAGIRGFYTDFIFPSQVG